jgi:C4-dicarboxylate transporter DctM subunit
MSNAMDIEPIHMGIVFIVNLEIGYLTPPIGLNLFVASTLFRRGLGEVIWAVLPPLAILFTGLMCITWIPVLSTGLVNVVNGEPLFGVPDEPAGVVAPVDPVAPPPGSGKVKTLQELMQDQNKDGDSADAAPGRVKTLQELMADQKKGAEGAADAAPEEPGRVKSLAEMMAEQKAKRDAAAAPSPSPDKPADKPRVKSLQEMMAEQKAKRQAEGGE